MSAEKRGVREILAGIEATIIAQKHADELFQTNLEKRLDNHGKRIKDIERLSYLLTGAGAVVGVALRLLWSKVQDKFHVGSA